MELSTKEEVRIVIDDDRIDLSESAKASCSIPLEGVCICRICHEEEEESCTTMESPCSCAGTLKFAHRECIQKWCDEKANNVCEICLQKYEPGYTIPERKALADIGVTIRDSLEVPRLSYEPLNDDAVYANYAELKSTIKFSRVTITIFIIMLLLRQVISVCTDGAYDYEITVLTLFVLRASGIFLPFFFVMRFISAVQEARRQNSIYQLYFEDDSSHAIDVKEADLA